MKILVIPKTFFGDVILTTAALTELRARHPDAHISVLLPPAALPLLSGLSSVTELIPFDRRKAYSGWRGLFTFAKLIRGYDFDKVFSFQRGHRAALLCWLSKIPERVGYTDAKLSFLYTTRVAKHSASHEVERNISLVLEGGSSLEPPALSVPRYDREIFSERVREVLLNPSPFIVLVPGSAWLTKRWYAGGYHSVAREYLKRGLRVVLVGAPNEVTTCESVVGELPVINLAGRTSLSELIEIVRDAAAVVCNDSMALHIASATQTPNVAIFCATSPLFGFGPWKNRGVVVQKEGLFCKPCRRHGSNRCPVGTESCMKELPATGVIAAIDLLCASLVGASSNEGR